MMPYYTVLRTFILAGLLLLALPAAAKKGATGITTQEAETSLKSFVEAMNSLSEKAVLDAISAGDRMSLAGRDNLLGLISENKIVSAAPKSIEQVRVGPRLIGAKVQVAVEEVDPLDGTRLPKEYTWFLVKEGKELKVSILGLWLAQRED